MEFSLTKNVELMNFLKGSINYHYAVGVDKQPRGPNFGISLTFLTNT